VNAVANELAEHFLDRVRIKLEKLRVRGIVLRGGREGAHRQYTYRLLRPDRVAMALCEKGGGLSRNKKRRLRVAEKENLCYTLSISVIEGRRR
jgi:hypothetical protein